MDMGFFLQKERIFPGAHKIGAAISGPRIADKTFYGHEDFSDLSKMFTASLKNQLNNFSPPRICRHLHANNNPYRAIGCNV